MIRTAMWQFLLLKSIILTTAMSAGCVKTRITTTKSYPLGYSTFQMTYTLIISVSAEFWIWSVKAGY